MACATSSCRSSVTDDFVEKAAARSQIGGDGVDEAVLRAARGGGHRRQS